MRKFTLVLLSSVAISASSFAQQDARFTHYYFNQIFFNPAYAGLEGTARFSLLGRQQWLGYNSGGGSGAPRTVHLSAQSPLLRANSGVGVNVVYETFAANAQLAFNANYAYHLNLGAGKLSFGVSAGATSNGRDANLYVFNDKLDPNVPTSINSIKFDAGAGVYYKSPKFFLGVSSTHLTQPVYELGNKSTNQLLRHYYGIAGYNFELNPTLTLTPHVLYKSTFKPKGEQIEGGIMANINNKFYVGLNYTQEEAASVLAGISLLRDNSLRFGYSLDLVTNGVEAKSPTSHEIMLSYVIPVTLKGPKPAIRTPRYRK